MSTLLERFPAPWTVEDRTYVYNIRAANGALVTTVEDTELAQAIAAIPDMTAAMDLAVEESLAWREGKNNKQIAKAKVGACYGGLPAIREVQRKLSQ